MVKHSQFDCFPISSACYNEDLFERSICDGCSCACTGYEGCRYSHHAHLSGTAMTHKVAIRGRHSWARAIATLYFPTILRMMESHFAFSGWNSRWEDDFPLNCAISLWKMWKTSRDRLTYPVFSSKPPLKRPFLWSRWSNRAVDYFFKAFSCFLKLHLLNWENIYLHKETNK